MQVKLDFLKILWLTNAPARGPPFHSVCVWIKKSKCHRNQITQIKRPLILGLVELCTCAQKLQTTFLGLIRDALALQCCTIFACTQLRSWEEIFLPYLCVHGPGEVHFWGTYVYSEVASQITSFLLKTVIIHHKLSLGALHKFKLKQ